MSSDSGMTPEKAKAIVDQHQHLDAVIHDDRLHNDMDRAVRSYLKAFGFVHGVAYQEEKAKGLIAAIEPFLDGNHDYLKDALGIERHQAELCRVCAMQKALAHYRQGQEKK